MRIELELQIKSLLSIDINNLLSPFLKTNITV